eukprot:16036634-Heterocapsa_arctica.AAC.1
MFSEIRREMKSKLVLSASNLLAPRVMISSIVSTGFATCQNCGPRDQATRGGCSSGSMASSAHVEPISTDEDDRLVLSELRTLADDINVDRLVLHRPDRVFANVEAHQVFCVMSI